MSVITYILKCETEGNGHCLDLTPDIQQSLRGSQLRNGIVTVFTPSSTSALTTIEYEDGALQDFKRLFTELAPEDKGYQHNLRWQDGNGHSHVRAALLGASLTIPFVEYRLMLGQWQQVLFIDFDNKPRQRSVVCQIMGE